VILSVVHHRQNHLDSTQTATAKQNYLDRAAWTSANGPLDLYSKASGFESRKSVIPTVDFGRISKESFQVRGSVRFFVTSLFLW
jgi:hypothetical protein